MKNKNWLNKMRCKSEVQIAVLIMKINSNCLIEKQLFTKKLCC